MPHPQGAKTVYLSPDLIKEYPNLTTRKLQEFLWIFRDFFDILWDALAQEKKQMLASKFKKEMKVIKDLM